MRPFYYEFSRQGLLLSLISLERTEQFLAYQKEEPIFWFEKIISLRVKLAENNSVNFKAKNVTYDTYPKSSAKDCYFP